MNFQCNQCGVVLDTESKHVVLPCLHLYCVDCAQKQLESDSTCFQCGSVFSHKTVKGVAVLQDANKHALTLCGQTPDVILQSALTAINCFNKQAELAGQLRESKLQRRMELLHAQCNEKLQQVHGAYTKAKAKSASLATQLHEAEEEKRELLAKYQDKNSQLKQLKAQVQQLQQKVRMQHMQQPGQAGQQQLILPSNNHMSMATLNNMNGNMSSMRPLSPSGSGGTPHMVTTVQRTQFFMGEAGHQPGMLQNMLSNTQGGGGGGGGGNQRRMSLGGGSILGGGGGGGGNSAGSDMAGSPSFMMGGLNSNHGGSGGVVGITGGGGSMAMGAGANMKRNVNSMQMQMQRNGGGGGTSASMRGVLQPSNKLNLMGSPNPFG